MVAILISFAAGLISLAAYRRGGANIVVDAKIAMKFCPTSRKTLFRK